MTDTEIIEFLSEHPPRTLSASEDGKSWEIEGWFTDERLEEVSYVATAADFRTLIKLAKESYDAW